MFAGTITRPIPKSLMECGHVEAMKNVPRRSLVTSSSAALQLQSSKIVVDVSIVRGFLWARAHYSGEYVRADG